VVIGATSISFVVVATEPDEYLVFAATVAGLGTTMGPTEAASLAAGKDVYGCRMEHAVVRAGSALTVAAVSRGTR
jgi:hypothetical protein